MTENFAALNDSELALRIEMFMISGHESAYVDASTGEVMTKIVRTRELVCDWLEMPLVLCQ